MKITINVHYRTQQGEELSLQLADGTRVAMSCAGDQWRATLQTAKRTKLLRYSFEVLADGVVARSEWGAGHCVELDGVTDTLVVCDAWSERPTNRAPYTSLFADTLFAHSVKSVPTIGASALRIEVEAPTLDRGERLALLGSTPSLGEWNPSQARPMRYVGDSRWAVVLEGVEMAEYKFVVTDASTGKLVRWEEGENRRLMPVAETTIVRGLRLRDAVRWRGAGVAVPMFSLRSESSFGVGDFADLRLLADWCHKCGGSVIQILPINDTTMTGKWSDSYPYNANSTIALHPMYIRLEEVARLRKKSDRERFERLAHELNELPALDYERVMQAKFDYLHIAFAEQGAKCRSSRAYKEFVAKNECWLTPYAVYSVLRDQYKTPDFKAWGRYATYSAAECASFAEQHSEQVDFYRFVQFHLDRQLRLSIDYARSLGVALKGDIPIGVSPVSVDAWVSPELFVMSSSAGAPPDDFSATGQNWGFPIYNWEEMAKDGYAWWKMRFRKMAEYFDAYRIDHILGFFRIWEVPLDAVNALLGEFNPSLPYTAEEIVRRGVDFEQSCDVAQDYASDNVLWLEYRHKPGHYYPRITPFDTECFASLTDEQKHAFAQVHNDFYYHRHNAFWKDIANSRLSMLVETTRMLTCGEDLGMIPDCVPEVMQYQQILSLEIERMPKCVGVEFADVMHYPYMAVCTTSTHDMNPLRAWWCENREATQRYYNYVLCREGRAPLEATPDVCRAIVNRHLASPAMLTILPLQDWLSICGSIRYADGEAERINVPSNPKHYWRYRMHLTLEALLAADEFNADVERLIKMNGR